MHSSPTIRRLCVCVAYLEVGVIKTVNNVPAKRKELPPLNEKRMKEAKGKEELLVLEVTVTARERGLVH